MASRAVPAVRPRHPRHLRHLRLVPAAQRPLSAARAEAATRRTVALLLASSGILTVGGLIMVLSASSVWAFSEYGSSFLFFRRQAAYAAVGTAALLLTSRMRYRVWQRLALPFLGLTLVLLALVLNPRIGTEVAGSARWLTLGPVTIQPSELAKLALVAFTAAVLTRKWNRLHDLGHVALPLLPVALIVCGMVYAQPDLGTTVILAGSAFLLLFVAGVRLRHLVAAGLTSAALGTALMISSAYQRARFLAFLHPWADPRGRGWQLSQSLIALGSGGWLGVGLGASRQKWMYVPNAHTDFIFAILGEELGLVGEIVVLVLFGALIYAGIKVAARAPDVFGRLLAAGIVGWLGLQTIVNLGAVTGLLPITGVPLPFLSYGGSALVVSMAAVGILVNIARSSSPHARRRKAAGRPAR
ncbi:MAG: putative lipid II flippase FtsW [Actinobacteria bacterium]|nr:putative lipid II flippase FtsW [Actinomycetota bacterium]